MKSAILFVIFLFTVVQFSQAQPNEGKFIDINLGYGITYSNNEDVPSEANGFFMQGEYVVAVSKWFGFRPYVGLNLTSNSTDEQFFNREFPDSKINMNAVFTGGKFRVAIPIPYISPYIESGVGVSFGNFETINQFENLNEKGAQIHIPVSLGLVVGKNHNFELAFKYFFHPNVNLISGAITIGFSIPLEKEAQ